MTSHINIQYQSYKELCKQFEEAEKILKRKQRWATFAFLINMAAFIMNLLCIYLSIRG